MPFFRNPNMKGVVVLTFSRLRAHGCVSEQIKRVVRSRLLWTMALALVLSVVGMAPASAHDQLIATDPQPRTSLVAAPKNITLTFSAKLMTLGYEVLVVGNGEKNYAAGAPQLTGALLSQPLAADMPPGQYEVRWRVVSSDGHPINGLFSFAIGEAYHTGVPTPRSSPSQSSLSDPPNHFFAQWSWLLVPLGGAGVGVAGYMVVVYITHRRKKDPR